MEKINTLCPRPEHPMPQWVRKNWKNLNGKWEFEKDGGASAVERKLWEKNKLDSEIIVPFCPESVLSGIGDTDFMLGVAYRRKFKLTKKELTGRVILKFGAVDYDTTVYVNSQYAGNHKGGYTSFEFDITDYVNEGENTVFVAVKDDCRSGIQPAGKQSYKYASNGCDYTRTTGIWQTVWLEFVPKDYIISAKYYTDIDNATLTIVAKTCGKGVISATAKYQGKVVGRKRAVVSGNTVSLTLNLSEVHLWEIGDGKLYDLTLTFNDDKVESYFGMRSTKFEGYKYFLNGKSTFLRLVLDQGFYPDGIYTAPSEEALINDIVISQNAGFNGARLHQKVFEPRFLYHCDRMGYMVFGEYPNWKLNMKYDEAISVMTREWQESVERDFNHPSIIGWCPINETWEYTESRERSGAISTIYRFALALDPTRPSIDTSGNYHAVMDIYDMHDYDQNPETFAQRWNTLTEKAENMEKEGKKISVETSDGQPFFRDLYEGQPIFVSEYGGIQWNTKGNIGWGYGVAPKSEEEFKERYKKLTEVLIKDKRICGLCYTQLYDIEQEINGLYTYDRQPKFDINFFKEVNSQIAEIEKQM